MCIPFGTPSSYKHSRESKDGDFDAASVTEFASGHREAFAHQNRQQRENQRGKHEENIGGNDAGIIFNAGSRVGVADADGDDQRQQTHRQGRQKQLECGVEELLRAETAGEEGRHESGDGVDDEEEDVGLQDPNFVAAEMPIHGRFVAVGHGQGEVDQKTAGVTFLGKGVKRRRGKVWKSMDRRSVGNTSDQSPVYSDIFYQILIYFAEGMTNAHCRQLVKLLLDFKTGRLSFIVIQ